MTTMGKDLLDAKEGSKPGRPPKAYPVMASRSVVCLCMRETANAVLSSQRGHASNPHATGPLVNLFHGVAEHEKVSKVSEDSKNYK